MSEEKNEQGDGTTEAMLSALGLGEEDAETPKAEPSSGPPKPNSNGGSASTSVAAVADTTPAPPAPREPPAARTPPRPRAPAQSSEELKVARLQAEAAKAEAQARKEEAKRGKSSAVAKLIGSGDVIKLYRVEGGQRHLVGNFTERDISGYDDLEDFVYDHIRPTWGYGVYETALVTSAGVKEGPEIRLLPPMSAGGVQPAAPSFGAPASAAVTAKDLLAAQREGEERYIRLSEQVKKNGGSDGLAAMMVEMMRQQQQEQTAMVRPLIEQAQRRMTERPAPPPPPPPDTTAAEAIKALSSIVEKVTSAPAKDDGMEKLLSFMREDRERDRERREQEEQRRRDEERERVRRDDEREKQRAELERHRIEFEAKQREKDREHAIEMAKLQKTGDALTPLEQTAKAMEMVDKIRGPNATSAMDLLGMFIENFDQIAEKAGGAIVQIRSAQAKSEGAGGEKKKPEKPAFPESIAPHVDDMKRGAKEGDEAVMVTAAMKTIGLLANDRRWSRAAKSLLIRVGKGEKEEVFKELESFLAALVDTDGPITMDVDTAKAVMAALEKNWDIITEAASSVMANAGANK